MPELVAGPGITITPDVGAGTITVSGGAGFATPQGAAADNSTNDNASFVTAFSDLASDGITGFGYGLGTSRLYVPKGDSLYYMGATPVDLDSTTRIEGDGVGNAGGWSSAFRWGANSHGFRVQYYGTSGNTTAGGTNPGGTGSIISGIAVSGAYNGTTATDGEYHGFFLRSRAAIRDFNAWDFQGDGVHIHAGVGLPESGNANNWEVGPAWIQNTRNGVYSDGSDTNTGIGYAIQVSGARQWGFYDNSGTGNLYVAPLTQLCGLTTNDGTAGKPVSVVTNVAGTHHFAVIAGRETPASTNAPPATATDDSNWYYYEDGGPDVNCVTWFSGIELRAGGPYRIINGGVILNGYAEVSQPPAQLGGAVLRISGSWGCRVVGGGFISAAAHQVIINSLRIVGGSSGGGITIDDDVSASVQIGRYSAGAGVAILAPTAACANLTIASPNNTPSILVANTAVSLLQPFGYGTGVGGAVTQATSRTTGVTLNKICGAITLFSAAGTATWQTFTVTNSTVAATDTIHVSQKSGTDKNMIFVTAVAAGSFDISFATTGGTTTEQPVFNFAVIKAVAA